MMKTLTNFGIVLVVLAMVTGSAFAATYIGPAEAPDNEWCITANWSGGKIPSTANGESAKIEDDDVVLVDPDQCGRTSYGADGKLELRDNCSLIIGVAGGNPATFVVNGELEMSDGGTSEYTILDIVNGDMTVKKECKDVFEDGSGEIKIAAGSSLTFDLTGNGIYFGDSNGDGCNDTYTLDIAGDFSALNDRFEHRGGHLTINLTGNGTLYVEKTSRLSSKRDAITTVNITDDAVCEFDKVELGEGNDGAECDYSLAINLSGNGKWDGGGEDLQDQDEGQIFKLDVTGNGSFTCDELDINDDDSEIHITMDSGTIDIENDIDMEAGTIVITGGVFNVEDDLKLGDKAVATMTVSGTADVWIDDLYMGKNSALTIDGVRMDIDDLKEMKSGSSIVITPNGSLVIKNADDQDDWDELNDLVADGQIVASAGATIVTDYGVSHDDRFTIQAVYPFDVDIKPGSCVNPLRVNFTGQGVFPVVVVGSATFDVTTVDADTATLVGVPALRSFVGDVSTAGDCVEGPDGTADLVLKFRRADVLEALTDLYGAPLLSDLPNRAELSLLLLAETTEGDTVGGTDTLEVLNRGAVKRRR